MTTRDAELLADAAAWLTKWRSVMPLYQFNAEGEGLSANIIATARALGWTEPAAVEAVGPSKRERALVVETASWSCSAWVDNPPIGEDVDRIIAAVDATHPRPTQPSEAVRAETWPAFFAYWQQRYERVRDKPDNSEVVQEQAIACLSLLSIVRDQVASVGPPPSPEREAVRNEAIEECARVCDRAWARLAAAGRNSGTNLRAQTAQRLASSIRALSVASGKDGE